MDPSSSPSAQVKARLFTGRQIATMVVALCIAAVFTPVTVYAATGTSVNIVDKNDASRKARVNTSGQLLSAVTGTVNARIAVPAKPFHREGKDLGSGVNVLGAVAKGKNVAITSVTSSSIEQVGLIFLQWRKAMNGSCAAATQVVGIVTTIMFGQTIDSDRNYAHTFAVPQVRPATDTALCLVAKVDANPAVLYITVDGFLY